MLAFGSVVVIHRCCAHREQQQHLQWGSALTFAFSCVPACASHCACLPNREVAAQVHDGMSQVLAPGDTNESRGGEVSSWSSNGGSSSFCRCNFDG